MKNLFIVMLWEFNADKAVGKFRGEFPMLAVSQDQAIELALARTIPTFANSTWFGSIKTMYKGVLNEPGSS